MTVKLLAEHHLEFLSLKGGRRGSPEFTHVKMPHCWKYYVLAYYRIWAVNEILVLIAYSQKLPMNANADFSSLVRGIVCACVDIKISVCLLWHIIAENGFCVKTRYALLITLTVKSNRQRASLYKPSLETSSHLWLPIHNNKWYFRIFSALKHFRKHSAHGQVI